LRLAPGCFIDANILIYARRGMSEQCRVLLERCAQREVSGVLTTIALAEFCHRRMMQEAQSQGLSGSNPARALGQNPALVRQLIQYRQDLEDLIAGQFSVLNIAETDFVKALELQRLHGLLTNDSLHLAAGLRVGVNRLATADPQFETVPGITVFKPDDL